MLLQVLRCLLRVLSTWCHFVVHNTKHDVDGSLSLLHSKTRDSLCVQCFGQGCHKGARGNQSLSWEAPSTSFLMPPLAGPHAAAASPPGIEALVFREDKENCPGTQVERFCFRNSFPGLWSTGQGAGFGTLCTHHPTVAVCPLLAILVNF